jgi:sialic acid synthase SpsE
MWCVSKYPTILEDYDKMLEPIKDLLAMNVSPAISDHTTDFELWHKYKPSIIEWHMKLSDSTGPDAGPFSRTPEQLAAIL